MLHLDVGGECVWWKKSQSHMTKGVDKGSNNAVDYDYVLTN